MRSTFSKSQQRSRTGRRSGTEEALAGLQQQRTQAVFKERDHYQGLLDEDLLPAERTQQSARHTSSALTTLTSGLDTLAGLFYLIPRIGSPFAMVFGGVEIGESTTRQTKVLRDNARVADAIAGSAGIEANFARRRSDWKLQKELAERRCESRQADRCRRSPRSDRSQDGGQPPEANRTGERGVRTPPRQVQQSRAIRVDVH